MQERLTIDDPKIVRASLETRTVRLLEPFMTRPLTLSEAAKALGVKLPNLHYHVGRFLQFGLLEVAGVYPRSGRAVTRYRSAAKAFFVPFHATPSETLERLLADLSAPGARRFQRGAAHTLQHVSPTWGLYITAATGDRTDYFLTPDEHGRPRPLLDVLSGPGAPAIFSAEGLLRLDFETAKALQTELRELERRYRANQQDSGQPYAFRLGLTPARADLD